MEILLEIGISASQDMHKRQRGNNLWCSLQTRIAFIGKVKNREEFQPSWWKIFPICSLNPNNPLEVKDLNSGKYVDTHQFKVD